VINMGEWAEREPLSLKGVIYERELCAKSFWFSHEINVKDWM